jgi:lipopolysaccharide transport system ATP-binding protein
MYVRLAFAVAAHLEPEILIVDEVLAVGDAQFQKKCLGKMGEVASQGRTVLFVSHNMAAIRTLCSTAMLLDQGAVAFFGSTLDCLTVYESENTENRGSIWERPVTVSSENTSLIITRVISSLLGLQPHLELVLEIQLRSLKNHKSAFLAIDISDSAGSTIMQAIPSSDNFIHYQMIQHFVKVNIQLPPLIPMRYLVSIWVGSHNTETIDFIKEVTMFEIDDSPVQERSFPHSLDHGYICPISTVSVLQTKETN